MANQRGETTSIGHFYNRCVDAVNNLFDTMSFWTHSKDVEFVDGKTAETKVGAINGITSDMSGEADDIAASIKCVNQLNNSLGGLSFGKDGDGNYGYYGADGSLIPFKSKPICCILDLCTIEEGTHNNISTNNTMILDDSKISIINETTFNIHSSGKYHFLFYDAYGRLDNFTCTQNNVSKMGTLLETLTIPASRIRLYEFNLESGNFNIKATIIEYNSPCVIMIY